MNHSCLDSADVVSIKEGKGSRKGNRLISPQPPPCPAVGVKEPIDIGPFQVDVLRDLVDEVPVDRVALPGLDEETGALASTNIL